MKCPFCRKKQETKVIDSREVKNGRAVRRRRECLKCGERFTTYEDIEVVRLTIIKRDGSKEEYDRRKIEEGIRRALKKRPVNEDRIDRLLNEIEYDIRAKEKRSMASREIGRIIMDKLRE